MIRTEPYSIEAEQAVLGCMIIERECIDTVMKKLQPSDFYLQPHKDICQYIYQLYNENKPVEFVTLSEKHDIAYLAEMMDIVSTTESIKNHIDIVKSKSIRRKYIDYAKQIIDKAYDGNYESILDFKNDVQQIIDIDVGSETKEIQDMRVIVDLIDEIEKKRNNNDDGIGIKYGFYWIDKQTCGIHESDLTILAARPSVGKTALACQIAINVARQNKHVAIFSLEMSTKQLGTRILSNVSGVESHKMRNVRMLNDGDWDRLSVTQGNIYDYPIYFHDTAFKVEEIRNYARKLKNKGNLDYIIIDYLQLCDTQKKCNSTNDRVSHLSRQFKLLAKELNVSILLLSQLSRQNEKDNRRPALTDLRDSGSIEQDADNVFFLHDSSYGHYEQKQENRVPVEFIIAKQRNGVRDIYCEIDYIKAIQRFENKKI